MNKHTSSVSLIDGHIEDKDNEIIKVGDVCAYFYNNQNTSLSIVEVVRELSDERVVVKFHQVFRDDSGNGLFTYLISQGKTMNVSRKYLHKIDLINRQKAQIKQLENIERLATKNIEKQDAEIELLQKTQQLIESEAIKEVLSALETMVEESDKYIREYEDSREQRAYNQALRDVYNLVKEMTE